eukprot:7569272-Pyramimonas_sp.AAC.1
MYFSALAIVMMLAGLTWRATRQAFQGSRVMSGSGSFDDLGRMFHGRKDASPGPDGIAYSSWNLPAP